MAILAGDIKLVASQVMGDVPEGGGAPTSTVILDGQSNAVFPDISELDRAGGRVNLRKLHISVQTPDTDTYLGSNIIVAEPPTDPNVSVTLFSTKETFDRRTDAKKRLESYLARGPSWPAFLLENHIAGQRSIQLFQQPETELVPIGHTLSMVANEGLPNEQEQYIRVTRVTSVIRTFVDDEGKNYLAAVVTCEISDALRYSFLGSPPTKFFRKIATAALVRDTVVADAGVYAGVVKLTQPVQIGDLTAKVGSIFTQLVPNAQTETPMIDLSAAGQRISLIESANGTVAYVTTQPLNSTTVLSVGNSIYPKTLVIATTSGDLTDNGGQLYAGAAVMGTVDYARGEVRFAPDAPAFSGSKTITFRPSAAPLNVSDTAVQVVSQETRAYNYLITLTTPPAPGTMLVSYRSNGKWYDLRDNAGGVLVGADSSFGTGTVSYLTGTVAITVGALPDVGSSVLYNWGNAATFINRSNLTSPQVQVNVQLAHIDVAYRSVEIRWNDGVARLATDDGYGNIIGAATGTIRYQTGAIAFNPVKLPAGGQEYEVSYSYGAPTKKDLSTGAAAGDGSYSLDLGAINILPDSIELTFTTFAKKLPSPPEALGYGSDEGTVFTNHIARDDGAGLMKSQGLTVGTINYATGIVRLDLSGAPETYQQSIYQKDWISNYSGSYVNSQSTSA